MDLFTALLLGHLIGDFPLQNDTLVRLKNQGQFGILLHVSIHVLVTAALLRDPIEHISLLVTLFVIHWLIDTTKVHYGSGSEVLWFIVDQIAPLTSLIIIAGIWSSAAVTAPQATLPQSLLYPALFYAAVLGLMVLCWVWANSLSDESAAGRPYVAWARSRLLDVSHTAGLPFIGAMIVWTISLHYLFY